MTFMCIALAEPMAPEGAAVADRKKPHEGSFKITKNSCSKGDRRRPDRENIDLRLDRNARVEEILKKSPAIVAL